MSTKSCQAKVPVQCRVHGMPSKIERLKREAQDAAKAEDIQKFFDLKHRITTLEKLSANPDFGMRPRDAVHPVIVYGTLRPSGSNYGRCIKGFSTKEQTVELEGYTMYDGQGFPFLTKGEHQITATLIYLDDDSYVETMDRLDTLEGYHDEGHPQNGYDRVLQTVEVDGKKVTAWLYVAASGVAEYAQEMLPVIEQGDWLEHDSNRFNKVAVLAE